MWWLPHAPVMILSAPVMTPSAPGPSSAPVVTPSAPGPSSAPVVTPSAPGSSSAPVVTPVVTPSAPVITPDGPSTEEASGSSLIRARYSAAQKKKVAQYARFHGGRTASKHFNIHHKNVQRWLKEELDTMKHPRRAKRCNKKGQGRKLSYPVEVDM